MGSLHEMRKMSLWSFFLISSVTYRYKNNLNMTWNVFPIKT
jgi:hypothetical protein